MTIKLDLGNDTEGANIRNALTLDSTLAVTGATTLTGAVGIVDLTVSNDLTMGDAGNVILNATTGTQIGTATSQKFAFHAATPVDQAGATEDLGTLLSDKGLRAVGTAYPITTSGAVALTGALDSGAAIIFSGIVYPNWIVLKRK